MEDRTFHRVGGESRVPFKARLVCATNADLAARMKAGEFREDLSTGSTCSPSRSRRCAERPDDIEWLAARFVECSAQDTGARACAG